MTTAAFLPENATAGPPDPRVGLVLVTGAAGYIGGRLAWELLSRGYRVRVMVRAHAPDHAERWPRAEVAVAEASDPAGLRRAMQGVDTAYYLIHSLLLGPREFAAADVRHAQLFREAAEARGVRRIVYLGGLGDVRTLLSPHLRSRAQVGVELRGGRVPVTVLRAAVIIGSGSASYEIVHHLVRRLPVLVVPSWGRTRCQPIAVRDVIRYLVGVLETPETAGESYDIGGPDVLSYELMLRQLAAVMGRRRLFLRSPFAHLWVSAYVTSLVTPVPTPIVRSLMESLTSDVVCENDRIRRRLPFKPLSYREAVLQALTREEQDAVHTRWSDAYPPAHELAIKLHELSPPPRYVARFALRTPVSPDRLFREICAIGGAEGWFHGNWMWRLRGMLDRLLMGVGTSRGRRSATRLRVNDTIDFWRVESIVPHTRLLLRAEMKLPGRAWLDFRIVPDSGAGTGLSVTAHYDTASLFGRLYWYAFLPFHWYIFDNLLRQIAKRAGRARGRGAVAGGGR